MAAENSNKLKLAKMKLKCRLKIEKFRDVCMTEGIHYTPSHTKTLNFAGF